MASRVTKLTWRGAISLVLLIIIASQVNGTVGRCDGLRDMRPGSTCPILPIAFA